MFGYEVHSRPTDTGGRKRVKAEAAATMSLLMAIGLTRKAAEDAVAETLRSAGIKLGGRQQLKGITVRNWRTKMDSGSEEDCSVAAYREVLNGYQPAIEIMRRGVELGIVAQGAVADDVLAVLRRQLLLTGEI
jgi:hypothetical protein